MNRTRILLVALVAVILMRLYPDRTGVIEQIVVAAGILYCAVWAVSFYKRTRARTAQAAADEREYREYKAELDSIRAQYDPSRDPDDLTSIPPPYQDALTALHDKHAAMLTRKFGPRS